MEGLIGAIVALGIITFVVYKIVQKSKSKPKSSGGSGGGVDNTDEDENLTKFEK
jgi:hypothetical protein